MTTLPKKRPNGLKIATNGQGQPGRGGDKGVASCVGELLLLEDQTEVDAKAGFLMTMNRKNSLPWENGDI